MNQNKLNHFKEKLLKEKGEVLKALESMNGNEPNNSLKDYYSELSSYDNHPADIATETFEMEMNFNLKRNEESALNDINDALKRIENDTYGTCVDCGKNIVEERLEVIPNAKKCISCEKEGIISLEEQIHTRPVEEKVLGNSFGSVNMDHNDDYNGFDGEDSLEAVMRFNKTKEENRALDWYDNNMY